MGKLTLKEKKAQGIPKPYKGRRKRLMAERLKEAKRKKVQVKLRNFPYSPRKMKLVVDLVRGKSVPYAIGVLKWNGRKGAEPLLKLLRSALDVWEQKFGSLPLDENALYIKEIYVTEGFRLKRFRPAPFGRAHPIRKRRCHVTLTLGYRGEEDIEPISSVENSGEYEEIN